MALQARVHTDKHIHAEKQADIQTHTPTHTETHPCTHNHAHECEWTQALTAICISVIEAGGKN